MALHRAQPFQSTGTKTDVWSMSVRSRVVIVGLLSRRDRFGPRAGRIPNEPQREQMTVIAVARTDRTSLHQAARAVPVGRPIQSARRRMADHGITGDEPLKQPLDNATNEGFSHTEDGVDGQQDLPDPPRNQGGRIRLLR